MFVIRPCSPEPEQEADKLQRELGIKQTAYWRRTLGVTTALLAVWFVVTFVASYFARELNAFSFLGFPLGFYMGAQGALIVYLLIVGFYAWYMNRLDDELGVREGEE